MAKGFWKSLGTWGEGPAGLWAWLTGLPWLAMLMLPDGTRLGRGDFEERFQENGGKGT